MEKLGGTTQYIVLSELQAKEMHGYEIIATVERLTGKRPSAGQIYPLLKRLKLLGYVTVRIKAEGKKNMKFYRMTATGKKFFKSMDSKFGMWIKAALKSKIKVCAHCGCEIFRGGYSKIAAGRKLDFCCISCASSYEKT